MEASASVGEDRDAELLAGREAGGIEGVEPLDLVHHAADVAVGRDVAGNAPQRVAGSDLDDLGGLGLAGLVGLVDMSASTARASYNGVHVTWWLAVLALGVITAAVAYVSGVLASRALGARLASFLGLLEVLFSVIFAWLLLGQLPGPIQLLGGVLLLAGVIVVRAGEPSHQSLGPQPDRVPLAS